MPVSASTTSPTPRCRRKSLGSFHPIRCIATGRSRWEASSSKPRTSWSIAADTSTSRTRTRGSGFSSSTGTEMASIRAGTATEAKLRRSPSVAPHRAHPATKTGPAKAALDAALACRPDRGLRGDQPRPRVPLEVRLMPRQVHHLVERHPGFGAVRARNPQAERRVGHVVAARLADPELPVRHVCAARLVAGEQSVDVEAPLPRRLDHHLGKDRERLTEEEVARYALAATGAELIELVEAGEHRGEKEELAHLPADLEQAPRRLDVEGGRSDQVENGPEDGGGIRGVAIRPAQRPVQRRAAGVVARLEARAPPEQRLDQRHVAGEGGEHQRREALRRRVVDAILLGPREHLLEVLPLESLESAPGDPRALRLVLHRGLEPALPGKAIGDQLLFVEAGQLEELLFGLVRNALRRQRLVGERAQVGVVEYCPGDGPELH